MVKTQMIKILVVDDHEAARLGVKQILEQNFLSVEVGEAGTAQKGIAAVRQESWDLAIVAISLSDQNGLDLLCELHRISPQIPLMVLSIHPEEQDAFRVFRAGAKAYLTKHSTPEELTRAIKQVLTGQTYVTASIGEHMAGSLSKSSTGHEHHPLSERECEVLVLLAQGQPVKKIAQSLTLSTKTVSTYRARLLDKLQLATTTELIRYALDHHLVE